jgi:uncharacterized protein YbjT (DUF2867 family)
MVLVTGGTGFIGRRVLKLLVDAGMGVRTLLRPSPRTPNLPQGMTLDVAVSSLADKRGLRSALMDVDAVIHLAGGEKYGLHAYRSEEEIEGTRTLAEVAREVGIQRFIFLSQIGASLTSAYTVMRTKAASEEYIRKSGVPYTIIRSAVAYGPEDQFTTSIAMILALIPFVFFLPGDGNTLLQPLWVNDLATTLVWTLDEPGTLGQTYEIGGPEFLTFRQVVDLVMEATNKKRYAVPFRQPYLRAGAWMMERLLRHPPLTTVWLDYLAINRSAELGTLPRVFGLQPTRMETSLEYLQNRSWIRAFVLQQFGRAGRSK